MGVLDNIREKVIREVMFFIKIYGAESTKEQKGYRYIVKGLGKSGDEYHFEVYDQIFKDRYDVFAKERVVGINRKERWEYRVIKNGKEEI